MKNRLLFVHDGPLFKSKSGDYYGVHVDDKLVNRYKLLSKDITLLMRVMNLDDEELQKYSKLTMDNLNVVSIPDFKSIKGLIFNYFRAREIVNATVDSHQIIVVRQPSASGTMAAKEALRRKIPIMAEFVACTYDAYWNYNWKGKLIAHYKMWVQKKMVKKLPYLIYVTKEFLQKRYPSSAKQINCSNVELKSIDKESLNTRLIKIKNQTENRILKIGTVAALDVPFKGQADVIKAIAVLKRKGFNFEYHLVGQGDKQFLFETAQKENVLDLIKIVGPLKHEQVFDFYDQIDLYIQPSKQEGLPRALIEAMSRACPSLGARTAGIPELLDDDFIFQPGNVSEIAKKLTKFNKTIMLQQAEINFNKSQEFSREILEKRRKDFYDVFLKENNLK